MEVCQLILDSCAQHRAYYDRFFFALAERFCSLKKEHAECFEELFRDQYEMVHRLENIKLENVATFFAHLLAHDIISWSVRIWFYFKIKEIIFFYFSQGISLRSFNRRRYDIIITPLHKALIFGIS